MSKTAQAIKSGVVMGGTAILSAVNGLTPHMAGAIDIMVVQQPDGTLKCSPFYVRFGKYTPMRSKDKKVQIFVNDQEAGFSMHLGAYGQAYFAAETMEIVSDADDEFLTGMMSPSSGYSSDDEEGDTPYANAAMLSAVQQEVQRLQAAKEAAEHQGAQAAGDAPATPAAPIQPGTLVAGGSSTAAAPGANDPGQQHSSGGRVLSDSGSLSGSETDDETSSSSSSSLSDLPSPLEVAKALQQGLAAGAGPKSLAAATAAGAHPVVVPSGLPPISTSSSSSNGNAAVGPGSKRRHRKHLAKRVLQAAGDGAEGDPARSRLQNMLLDNHYSIKMQSDASFVASKGADEPAPSPKQQGTEHQQQPLAHSCSKLQHGSHDQQPQERPPHQQQPGPDQGSQPQQQQPQPLHQEQQKQQPPSPVRHVGFQLPPSSKPPASTAAAARAAERAGANGNLQQVHAAELPGLFDPTASYSMDEVSEATGTSRQSVSRVDSNTSVSSPLAAGAAGGDAAVERVETEAEGAEVVLEAAVSSSADMVSQPTLADGLQGDIAAAVGSQPCPAGARQNILDLSVGQQQQQLLLQQQTGMQQESQEEELVVSPKKGRDSLLSSGLRAQQAQQQQQQQDGERDLHQEPQQQPVGLQQARGSPQPAPETQQQQQQQAESQAADAATVSTEAAAAAGTDVQRSPSVSSSQDADATAILDDAAAVMPSGWGMHPAAEEAQQLSAVTPQLVPADTTTSSSSSCSVQAAEVQPSGVDNQATAAVAVATPVPAAAAAAAAAVQASSAPVSMLGVFAASPPVDSGYLGDSEAGALLGTSYEGATPRRGPSAAALAADGLSGPPGAGPLALGLAGFQLSLCGDLLRPGISAAEAQQVFETRRVNAQVWCERGVSLLCEPDLVVKIGGSLFSWQVAAPMVVGMLAFGGKWDNLLGLDPTGMYPIKVAEDHAVHTAKKSVGSSSSWRLWPFTGWREPSGSSSKQPQTTQQQQQQPGSSPSSALPPAAAIGSATTSALQPSGGSFTNLRALLGPGSKSAPGRAGDFVDGGEGAEGSTGGGVGVDAAGRPASFMSSAGSPPRPSRKKHIILIRKTLTPTSDQLSLLPLKPGANTITFRAGGAADLTAYVYLLRWNTRLVVSDVDGTITRSDLLGHVLPTLGVDWSHPGITQLFHNIARNGYQIMFLSSRAIAQANITREYLHSLVQNDFKMPSGPVIISPHGLLPSLYREIVVRRPHEFKIACLQDIRALFPSEWNPFYAGFGNRDTDEVAYREVGVPLSRTFTINPKGQIQKASTAVQSSTWSSLSAINDLVDEMFPALLQHSSSSINVSRGLQSVYTSFTDTLELAAALGAIEPEALVAAVTAEQLRRRSTSSCGTPAAADAAAAAAEDGSSGNQQAVQGSDTAGGSVNAAVASGVSVEGDGVFGGASGVLALENVGPAREEFNDLHFWRPSLPINIEEELAGFASGQAQMAA